MGKTRRGDKEFSREQKLLHENRRLKRELSTLRKQMARLDLDRYSQVREIIENHYQEERQQEGKDILENLKKTWACRECNEGYLEIFCYTKINQTWYYRICNNPSCGHRTKAQKYTPSVKGILRKSE